ncbi:uncharacterized protein METZ01_LOCUS20842 [marine metagenome]|uniref:Uncharacterized protein n=1 Tax=marine metagenome TaxID=408172 RepID=A0A381PNE1_9ZZZZ
MIAFLDHLVEDRWRPTLGQLFDGTHINNSIVEITFQTRHLPSQESSILPN